MAKIVGIHGIGHQYQGENIVKARWLPPLKDGLLRAGVNDFSDDDFSCAFYGDLFRPSGGPTPAASPAPQGLPAPAEVLDPWEQEMLSLWVQAAAKEKTETESEAMPQAAATPMPAATPQFIQGALRRLSHNRFFADLAEEALISDLKQVRLYLHDDDFRDQIQARIATAVDDDTRVVIGHSLGSIVAYETVCAHPEWNVTTLITLGSPLGIRNLVFDKLEPTPVNGAGVWPPSIERWTNVADEDDIVALVKALSVGFDGVQDRLIDNGAKAHRAAGYLSARETGEAIAAGL